MPETLDGQLVIEIVKGAPPELPKDDGDKGEGKK